MLNLRSVDLNLLPVFEAVYEERSLSRAAARLAMTQSAVSHALNRLRALFEDELFVRQSRGVARHADGGPDLRPGSAARSRRFANRSPKRAASIQPRRAATTSSRSRILWGRSWRSSCVGGSPVRRPGCMSSSARARDRSSSSSGLQDGRFDAALDWLPQAGKEFSECVAFDDGLVAMARHGPPVASPALARTYRPVGANSSACAVASRVNTRSPGARRLGAPAAPASRSRCRSSSRSCWSRASPT